MSPTIEIVNELLKAAEQDRQPLSAGLAVTHRCNERCRICYVPKGAGRELDTQGMVSVIRDLAGLGTLFLTVTGGEPFARKDLLTILSAAREVGLAVKVLTNATLIREAEARALEQIGVLSVHVTVFSTRSDVHDSITGLPGSLAETMQGLQVLSEAGVNLVLHTPLTRSSFEGYQEVGGLADEMGAAWIVDPVISPRRDGSDRFDGDRLTADDLARVLGNQGEGTPCRVFGTDGSSPVCGAGFRLVHVDPDGSVRPCVMDPRVAGNVVEKPLSEIWRDAPLFREIRSKTKADLVDRCAGCNLASTCGRCGAEALIEGGDYLGPSSGACLKVSALGIKP